MEHSNTNTPGYNSNKDNHFLIVGIGASAGGVAALRTFFEQVPADSGIAYVVILHLSPNHDSQLAEVLGSAAKIPVQQVTEKTTVQPNNVYVVPPNKHLAMQDGHINVTPNLQMADRRAPVDIFFRTLAESHKAHAVAVILSGTGANGSMGLKRVKENGGAVFVQSPREAEYSDMPRNAIATELIDEILNVADIPGKIVAYKESIGTVDIPVTQQSLEEEQQAALREIFSQLRLRTGHDFSNYKRATILRRIERRINVLGLASLIAYANFLNENPEETQSLLKDLLISVTNFFRDRDAFHYLETSVVPRLIQNKKADEPLRIWIAGCATGEEAYSVAMLLAEQLEGRKEAPLVQIFATDIDETALATARDGWYTLNDAADVSPDRLRRFFTPEAEGYRVKKDLRENILFALHNVIKDPPFSRLDMITCRNMLIYLNGTAQNRVMETFHFALKPGCFLFLGSSESVDGSNDLFASVNKQFQVFQSREAARRIVPFPDNMFPSSLRSKIPVAEEKETKTEQENRALERISLSDLHQRLLEQYAPPSLVVNETNKVVHISESAGRFLQIAGGEPTTDVLQIIRPELRVELRTALYQAVQKATNVEVKNLTVQTNGGTELINLNIRPVLRPDDTARGFVLIVFETSADKDNKADVVQIFPSAAAETVTRQLEEEITNLKSQLRSTNEQFEVQTEELKASNEELQAMNEELRSSAEELETSKEELQSINEELITVNQELKIKVEEISHANNDFRNLINSTDIGTIFLDRHLRVKMFTPAIRSIFNLITADLGRPLSDINAKLEYVELERDVDMVVEKLQTIEREVKVMDGGTYLMQISPYRTAEDHINGVVISFVNISRRKIAEVALRTSLDRTTEILESISDAFYTVDADFNIIYLNEKAEELWNRKRELLIGKNYWTEFPQAVDSYSYKMHRKAMQEREVIHYETLSAILNRWVDVSLYPNEGGGMSCYFRDMTERKEINDTLRNSEEHYRAIVNQATAGVSEMDVEGNFIMVNQSFCNTIQYTNQELLTMNVCDITHPDDWPFCRELLQKAIEPEGGSYTTEKRLLRKDGKPVWISESISGIRNKEEKTISIVAVGRDINKRKLTEDALRESEERLRLSTSAANIYSWQYDVATDVYSFSDNAAEILGVTELPVTADDTDKLVYPEDKNFVRNELETAIRKCQGFKIEFRSVKNDGTLLWLNAQTTMITDGDGKSKSLIGIAQDVSERKETEIKLHESEERYRIALEAGELATWDWNIPTNKVIWNKQHFLLFGVDHKEDYITPEYFLEFVYSEDVVEVEKQFSEVLGDKGIYQAEFRIQRKDNGKLRWMNGYGRVTERDANGKAIRVSGVMFDSTERREAEDNLKATKNSLNTALEAAKMGVWSINLTHGYFVDHSVKHDQLLGFHSWQEDWSTDKAKTHIIEEDKPKFDEAYNNMLMKGIFNLEARVKQTDGNVCWICYYGRAFEDGNGKFDHAAGVIFDISDRKTIEKQKDEFIGIASHELKTPVTSIKAYAEILQEMFTDSKDFASASLMEKLDGQVNRLTNLIKDLLDVTKVTEGQLRLIEKSFSIADMTKNMVEEMQRTTRQHRIKLSLASLPNVTGDEERLGQVLANLLSNAIKYSPDSKDVLIEAKYEDNKIVISVQDFGIGMSKATVNKLFTRFFRSDNPSVRSYPGLGLGLFISMEIMKRHSGTISVQSEKGKGSVFTMILPVNL